MTLASPDPAVSLRPVRDDDSELLLHWRNEADAVRFSVSGREVTAEEHQRWFGTRGQRPGTRIWVAERAGIPVGQVRVDVSAGVATVSIAVDAQSRGRGIGLEMLRALVELLDGDPSIHGLRAVVHGSNAASLRLFERAGFSRQPGAEGDFVVLTR